MLFFKEFIKYLYKMCLAVKLLKCLYKVCTYVYQ